jgi:hypothetical protein
MPDFDRLSAHVFDGEALPQGADPEEVRLLTALRDTLKATPVPECRLGVEHLRTAVLDSTSRQPSGRAAGWVWAFGGLGLAAGLFAVLWARVPGSPDVPAAPSRSAAPVATAEPQAGPVLPPSALAMAEPEPAAEAVKEAPALRSRPAAPRPKRTRPARADAAPEAAPAASAGPGRPSDAPAAETVVASAAPPEEIVIVRDPASAPGTAIEVELGEFVVFGG